MAILNNLIVHGRSRFLNGINANTINAKSIGANKGVFNELIATTLNVETATIDDLTAQNATVVGLLDVRGELKTNTWSNSNIATIEGNFFIAPTLASGTGETLVSGLTIGFASNNWTITITGTFDLNQIGADPVDSSDTATNQWSVGSKVLITGEIGKTDGIYPLGTLMGEIQSASPSSFTITKVTDNLGKTDILSTLGTGTYQYRNVKISLTQRKYGNSSTASDNMRPIGILMSAQGRSSKSFIDIYGGANNLRSGAISGATTDFGGLAIPNVRIGNLRGLPNVVSGDFTQNESLPTGWGIYTDNGYFKGTIVSTSGKIGNFTIDANSIYSGSHSAYNSNNAGIYLGRLNSSSSDYYIAGGPQAKWWLKSDGSAQIGAMTLSSAGVLAVPAANITGTLTASQIDVSGIITAGGIVTNTLTGGTFNTTDYIRVSTQASSSLTIGTSGAKTDWRIIAGKTFGVDKSGNLYATSANIQGILTAGAGSTIGPWSITATSIYKGSATYGAAGSGNMYFGDDGLSISNTFKVSSAGVLNATGAQISGNITANSLIIEEGASIGGLNTDHIDNFQETIDLIDNKIIKNASYIYASDPEDTSTYSETNTQLQYQALKLVSSEESLIWELNPVWASGVADNYITTISGGGISIRNENEPGSYMELEPHIMNFYDNNSVQASIGNISDEHIYGIIAEALNAYGSGAGVKFDNAKNNSEDEVRGRFIWVIRDNGHLSLKKY